MQLVKELLQLHEEFLIENLGTLKQVDKKFKAALFLDTKSRIDRSKIKAAAAAGKKLADYEKTTMRRTLKGSLGEKSTFEEQTVKTPAELVELVKDPANKVVLLKDGVHQYAIFVKDSWKTDNYKTASRAKIGIDFNVFNDLDPSFKDITDADRAMSARSGGKLYKMGFGPSSEVQVKDANDGLKTATVFATYIMTMLKKIKKTAQVVCFKADDTRIEKSAARSEQRKNSVPDLRNDSVRREYEKNIKYAFKARLDKYKSDKSIKVATPEEALRIIVDKGFLDKISIGGQTYDYHEDRINLKALRKPKETWGREDSYISYKINSDTAEYKKLANERTELRHKFIEINTAAGQEKPYDFNDEQEQKMDKLRPAGEFKLMLKLEGGRIVPGEIKFEKGFLW